MRHGGDDQQRGQPGHEEPAAEQPRVGAVGRDEVQPPAQRAEPDQPDDGEDVEQPALVAQRVRAIATGRQTMAKAAPSSSPLDRVGVDRYSEVGLRDAPAADVPVRRRGVAVAALDRTWVEQQGDDDGDGDGGEQQPHDSSRQASPPQPDQPDHHQRPQQVELLLHGEAPQVAQRREVTRRRVPLPNPDLVPVRHVAQCREDIAPQQPQRSRRNNAVYTVTPINKANSAGNKRRARRSQNCRKLTGPTARARR